MSQQWVPLRAMLWDYIILYLVNNENVCIQSSDDESKVELHKEKFSQLQWKLWQLEVLLH